MTASPQLCAMRAVVAAVDTIPGRFTPELVAGACSVDLREIAGSNPYLLEFESCSDSELFSTISLRVPRGSTGPAGILVMTPQTEMSFGQGDVARLFSLSSRALRIGVSVPPDGVITYSETSCRRTVSVQFTIRERNLRSLTVHDRANVAIGR